MKFWIYILAFGLLLPTIAAAQGNFNFPAQDQAQEEQEKPFWPYDPRLRPEANKPPENQQTLFSNSSFLVHFVHVPDAPANVAVLRISQPIASSGCMKAEMPAPEMLDQGATLRAKIGAPIVSLYKPLPGSGEDCTQSMSTIYTDIVLNRDDLIENNVRRLTLANDFGVEHYAVEVSESALTLHAESNPKLFKPNTHIPGKDPLVYYFYPENTLVLSVPQAKPDQDIYEQVKNLATRRGLIPLQSVVKDFRVLDEDRKVFYFVDQSGRMAKDLTPGQKKPIGQVSIQKMYQGPNGPYATDLNLNVYARLPGTLD
ncbi:MAG: hypothetical protein KDJ35_07300 [Alphaproteobacteria bacterium]|nr:hypothetical protein [Alphaproteobacteria bacterium]